MLPEKPDSKYEKWLRILEEIEKEAEAIKDSKSDLKRVEVRKAN